MQVFRKLLILSHRYIGIPLSFLFVIWFASAFLMIYTGGMPRITPEMRIEAAEPLQFSSVRLSPGEAAEIAGFDPGSATLRSVLDRPAYDFSTSGLGSSLVFADNGEVVNTLNRDQARRLAADFLALDPAQLEYQETLNRADQWTLTERADLPMYRFTADDGLGTEAYVSPGNASVSVYTTTRSRVMAWLSTIPHWFYFTDLRMNQPLWYDIVVWTSGMGCVLVLLGLGLGVTQFRRVRPFSLSRAIPYRGLLRWHYILGVIFGIFALTWAFSGLMSMEPFAWTRAQGLAVDETVYGENELDLAAFPPLENYNWEALPADGGIKEVEFTWKQGNPYLVASYSAAGDEVGGKRERLHQPYRIVGQARSASIVVDALSGNVKDGFDVPTLVDRLDAAAPSANVAGYEVLDEYDNYYYARNGQLSLPVLRVRFDDPAESWVYVDPRQSQLLTMVHKWSRLERWLFDGLHSLDFAFWYSSRPLWDFGVIFLLLGGFITSCIGLYFGLRRLKRDAVSLIEAARHGGVRPVRLGEAGRQ